jgi:hypothetical protein
MIDQATDISAMATVTLLSLADTQDTDVNPRNVPSPLAAADTWDKFQVSVMQLLTSGKKVHTDPVVWADDVNTSLQTAAWSRIDSDPATGTVEIPRAADLMCNVRLFASNDNGATWELVAPEETVLTFGGQAVSVLLSDFILWTAVTSFHSARVALAATNSLNFNANTALLKLNYTTMYLNLATRDALYARRAVLTPQYSKYVTGNSAAIEPPA